MRPEQIFSHRITIVTGHYGTGKTEFSVNLALALAKTASNVMLADLDIVNPYFRSRERKDELSKAGVTLVATSQACINADVPSLPPQLLTIIEDRTVRAVLDIGGDPVGARVLARYRDNLLAEDHQMLYVLNANRPEVRRAEQAVAYLRNIEAVTGLSCTGIVNNTHLCAESSPEDVQTGAQLAKTVSKQTGIPICCHTAQRQFSAQLPALDAPLFPIDIYMKKPWE